MIFMRPPDSDWNAIADETGDPSWRASAMHAYFQKIDNCQYRCFWRFIHKLSAGRINPTGHGFGGWLKQEGLNINKVPYKNPVDAANDLAEGRVQVYEASLAIVRPQMQAGPPLR